MVDGLERELEGRATVVRLNIAEPAGAEAQERFQTTKVPAIILLDTTGAERYRTEGKLPRRRAGGRSFGVRGPCGTLHGKSPVGAVRSAIQCQRRPSGARTVSPEGGSVAR